MQSFALLSVTAYKCLVLVRYGDRFRELRERAGLSQEQAAVELKLKKPRGSSVSNIELRSTHPPAPRTLERHAAALRCQPWELLAGVASKIDRMRAPSALSAGELSALLWGLAFVEPSDRRTALDQLQSFLDALPRGTVPAPALQLELEPQQKAARRVRRS